MKNKESWLKLCEQAAVEQDPKKLMELVTEINRLLQEKEQRLKSSRGPSVALANNANAKGSFVIDRHPCPLKEQENCSEQIPVRKSCGLSA